MILKSSAIYTNTGFVYLMARFLSPNVKNFLPKLQKLLSFLTP